MNQITKFVTYVDQIKEAKCEFKSFGGTEAGPKASKYLDFLIVTRFLCTLKKKMKGIFSFLEYVLQQFIVVFLVPSL